MPISTVEIMEACRIIADQNQLSVCVKESVKGGLIAGVGALSLGLLFGPFGIAVGM